MAELIHTLDRERGLALAELEGGGASRAICLVEALADSGHLAISRLAADEWLAVVWQEDDNTRQVTTQGQDRTVGAAAQAIIDSYGSLPAILEADPIPGQFNPSWFAASVALARAFDWQKWSMPWLVPATHGERVRNPEAALYVCEGVHRLLALATLVRTGALEPTPIEVVVAGRRVQGCC